MARWSFVLPGRNLGRSAEQELLDAEELDPRELRINLREMAMLNRLPGGLGASLGAVLRELDDAGRRADATVLDAGAGRGDLARRLVSTGVGCVIVSDLRREVLAEARRNLRDTNGVRFLEADVRALPLPDRSVAVAHASLLIHHLDEPDAVAALRELRRVATRAVLINDLRRGRVAQLVTSVTVLALSRGRYTRHDGVVSARRAYTLGELDGLAAEAGLRLAWRTPGWQPRVTSVYR
ncbi:MAG TPA: methyltransferase domain-containing protein [candidate division Zixibacteria bacterium]|nr:methyltransferase domain-containing protein [candidate division Zixibacteria bacterium]